MKSNINTVENKKPISIDKAINTINNALYSFLNNKRLEEKGTIVILPIDHAFIENGYLRLKKYNNCEGVSIPLADIDNISLVTDESTPAVHFVLTDGKEWVANLCGGKNNYRRQIESYKKIDEDEFIERLRKSRTVSVSHSIEHMSCNVSFDTVNIACPDFDDDEGETKVILTDSANHLVSYNIGLGYATKFHIEHECSDFNRILISLPEMPLLSKLYLTLVF